MKNKTVEKLSLMVSFTFGKWKRAKKMTQIKQFSSTTVLEAIADALPTSALQTLEFHVCYSQLVLVSQQSINDWLKRCKFSCSLQHFSQQLAKNRNLTALSISVCLCHSHWQLLHSSLRKSLEEVNCIPDLIEGAMNIPCLRKLSIEVPLSPLLCVSLLINCQRAAHMCMTSSKRRNLLQTWEICSRKILLWKN